MLIMFLSDLHWECRYLIVQIDDTIYGMSTQAIDGVHFLINRYSTVITWRWELLGGSQEIAYLHAHWYWSRLRAQANMTVAGMFLSDSRVLCLATQLHHGGCHIDCFARREFFGGEAWLVQCHNTALLPCVSTWAKHWNHVRIKLVSSQLKFFHLTQSCHLWILFLSCLAISEMPLSLWLVVVSEFVGKCGHKLLLKTSLDPKSITLLSLQSLYVLLS